VAIVTVQRWFGTPTDARQVRGITVVDL